MRMPSVCNHQQTSNMFILAMSIIIAFQFCDASGLSVTIPNIGTLLYSSTTSTWSSNIIFEFQGVRFAESPINSSRFKVVDGTLDVFVFFINSFSRLQCQQQNVLKSKMFKKKVENVQQYQVLRI